MRETGRQSSRMPCLLPRIICDIQCSLLSLSLSLLSPLEWGLMDLLAAKGCSKSLDTIGRDRHLQCMGGVPAQCGLLAVHGTVGFGLQVINLIP